MPDAIAWTPVRDVELLRRRAAGETWDQVAAALQLGRNSTIERGRVLGLEKRAYGAPAAVSTALEINDDRQPFPPGHPETWGAMTRGLCLEGTAYSRTP